MDWQRCLRGSIGCFIAAALLAIGCGEGRFPVCKSNADCEKRGGKQGKVCFNLRCVECHYDTDCPSGKVCSPTSTCQGFGVHPADKDAPPTWEPGSWDECAKECKDQACLAQCDARFHAK